MASSAQDDITGILQLAGNGDDSRSIASCRWFMKSSAPWRRATSLENGRITPCRQPPWFTRPTCGCEAGERPMARPGLISSRSRRRPFGGYWWITRAGICG